MKNQKISKSRLSCLILLTLGVTACGGGSGGAAVDPGPQPGSDVTYTALTAADPQSPYADVIPDCALANSVSESCTLMTLPAIGQETANPTIDDILARTVVSHSWMGTRFRQVLQRLPAEILDLMQPITAIVIAADIRPSYYSAGTGAIYLDPNYLWLTNAEKANVATNPDYRSEFGVSLSFRSLARYVKNMDYAWESFSLESNETRSLSDIDKRLAGLLFHEIAHASDHLPPNEIPTLDSTKTFYEVTRDLNGRLVSDQLTAAQPLNSQMMFELGDVMYGGSAPSSTQISFSPQQVGLEFEADSASDDYAYSTRFEDVAMLFEEVMMNYFFDIDREIAYTTAPTGEDRRYCDSYIVRWGQRSRIGDPQVRARLETALQLLLDRANVSAYLSGLANPQRMQNGSDWCDVRTTGNRPQPGKTAAGVSSVLAVEQRRPMRQQDLVKRH